ncbi:hypothetical protein ABL78_3431 [Leptomonas seymouri]|uniref:Uncharacterized protein n=1 Tax=Leptomonas seymouri TaxID=5684 RepID=A0A0N1IL05_LEPSE|nr:hypothetical protein ABL78_3431 [Leptomonas seymouri]|eukprot:KPI87482.1 hypothetical protein ABL78_3431 [Leptomonas seymouri]
MRLLVRQHASAAARLRSNSSVYRHLPTQAFRGGFAGLPCGFTSIESIQRWYSTTTVLRKQLPTSTGSAFAAARGPTPRAVSSNRGRKQSSAVASPNGASASVSLEPELEAAPTTVDDAVNTNTAVGSVSSPHRAAKTSTSSRAKASKRGRRKQANEVDLRSSTSVVGRETCVSRTSGSAREKKNLKDARGRRRASNAKITASATSTVADEPQANGTGAPEPPPFFDSAPPVYYTHQMLASAPRTEEQRMAERCSITKLIMVSASVSFLFTALPRTEGQLKMYVRDMNRVQVPTPAAAPPGVSSSAENSVPTLTSPLTSRQFHELRQRLCAEQYATNTVFIHVREMEQLVPPLHLQLPSASEGAVDGTKESPTTVDNNARGSHSSSGTHSRGAPDCKRRGRRGRRSRTQDAETSSSAAAPVSSRPVLSPVERLLALQEWKKAAARRAKETQARYPIPVHFHTITRVRFHDPHQTDLTVAMGGGLNKSADSVLRAILRNTHREESRGSTELLNDDSGSEEWLAAEEDDEDGSSCCPPFPPPYPDISNDEVATETVANVPEPEQPAFITSPYAVKPLLTVCASCVPRREAWIGTCSPKPSAAATETESVYSMRPFPTVPRFSTRITIMLEHDEMDPADLVSLAEISTTRKPSSAAAAARSSSSSVFDVHSDVSVRGGGVDIAGGGAAGLAAGQQGCTTAKRPVQLYCLVQDAGEY